MRTQQIVERCVCVLDLSQGPLYTQGGGALHSVTHFRAKSAPHAEPSEVCCRPLWSCAELG